MAKQRKPGPRFTTAGFYVEGRHFPGTDLGMECASAFSAKLCARYQRNVEILTCLLPGAAMLSFLRCHPDSADAMVANTDRHGYIITANGQTRLGVR